MSGKSRYHEDRPKNTKRAPEHDLSMLIRGKEMMLAKQGVRGPRTKAARSLKKADRWLRAARKVVPMLMLAVFAGLAGADITGSLVFQETRLHRNVLPPDVFTTQVPATPSAICARLTIEGVSVRQYDLAVFGYGSATINPGMDIQAAFWDCDLALLSMVDVPSVSTGPVPPGTTMSVTFVFLHDEERVLTGDELGDLATGSEIEWVVQSTGSGGSCSGGNCAVRISAWHSMRTEVEVFR